MGAGLPFQGEIWYWQETSYGGGENTSGPTNFVSDKVYDARIDTGDMQKALRGISEPSVCAYISQVTDPTLHLEWVHQARTGSSIVTMCCERNPDGDLESMAFCIGANIHATTPSYYLLKGCKAKTFSISASRNNEYICTADFSVQSVATSTTLTGTRPSALGTEYAVFNKSINTITITGKTAAAFITDSIEISVDNNLSDQWDCDSPTKVAAVPGAKDVTGSCDISLDDGGAVHWGDVFGRFALSSIAVVTGLTGDDDTFTINTAEFTNTSVDINVSGDVMMTSQPFIGKDLVLS